jgi:hypothetical protein
LRSCDDIRGNEWLVDHGNGKKETRRAAGGEGAPSSAPTQRVAVGAAPTQRVVVGAARDDVVCISSDEE